MSWERRRETGRYYYRKERQPGGRVRSRYVGRGVLADCVAELDGVARALARYRAAGVRRAEATLDGAGDAVEALTASVRSRLDAHMGGAGYVYRKGEWRRPRGVATRPTRPEARTRRARDRAAPLPTEPPMVEEEVPRPCVPPEADVREVPEPSPRAEVSHLSPLAGVLDLTGSVRSTRLHIERALLRGEGDPTHPALRAYGAAAGALADAWGDRRALPVGDAVHEISSLERRRLRGRIALGRGAVAGPHGGTAAGASIAVAAVLDEAGVDGRAALVAAVRRARSRLGWDAASALGRAVVDQLALAEAHADLVTAFGVAAATARKRDDQEILDEAVLVNLDAVAGPFGALGDALRSAFRAGPRSGASGEAAWRRRGRRARRRLADAARLLRHAKKAGLVPTPKAGTAALPAAAESPAADDPVASLSAPAPLDPLRGEAAEFAERMGQHVEALREAWPPPRRIRGSELFSDDSPWNPFTYTLDHDWEGEEDAWWVPCHEHATPDEVAADLATWAPEYVPP